MFAVIRAGGKQYRVAPGDVIRIEKIAPGEGKNAGAVEFNEVLMVSGEQGQVARPQAEARVTGEVVGQGLGEKVLVFHYKRKKQYKRLRGHRQPFTAVRITEIAFDGQKFTAPESAERTSRGTPKAKEGGAAPAAKGGRQKKTVAQAESGPAEGASGGRTAASAHAGSTKATGSKSKGGKAPAPKRKK